MKKNNGKKFTSEEKLYIEKKNKLQRNEKQNNISNTVFEKTKQ